MPGLDEELAAFGFGDQLPPAVQIQPPQPAAQISETLNDALERFGYSPPEYQPPPERAPYKSPAQRLEERTQYYRENGNPADAIGYWLTRLPIVGGVVKTVANDLAARAARDLQSGGDSEYDIDVVANYLARQEAEGQKGFLRKTVDLATAVPGFAAEFGLTGGTYAGAKSAAQRVVGTAAEGLAGRAAQAAIPRAVGALAQTALNPSLISESTSRRMIPELVVQGQGEESQIFATQEGDDFLPALVKGFGDAAIEIGSERTGGLLSKIPVPKRIQALKAAIASRWLRSRPGSTPSAFADTLKEAGWNGILGEMFEERVGEVARGVTGIEDDYGATGGVFSVDDSRRQQAWEQLGVEAAGFALLQGAASGANGLATRGPVVPGIETSEPQPTVVPAPIESPATAPVETEDFTPTPAAPPIGDESSSNKDEWRPTAADVRPEDIQILFDAGFSPKRIDAMEPDEILAAVAEHGQEVGTQPSPVSLPPEMPAVQESQQSDEVPLTTPEFPGVASPTVGISQDILDAILRGDQATVPTRPRQPAVPVPHTIRPSQIPVIESPLTDVVGEARKRLFAPPPPTAPTTAPPGSAGKIEEMRRRFERGERVVSDEDAADWTSIASRVAVGNIVPREEMPKKRTVNRKRRLGEPPIEDILHDEVRPVGKTLPQPPVSEATIRLLDLDEETVEPVPPSQEILQTDFPVGSPNEQNPKPMELAPVQAPKRSLADISEDDLATEIAATFASGPVMQSAAPRGAPRQTAAPMTPKILGQKTIKQRSQAANQEVADAFAEFKQALNKKGVYSNPFADPELAGHAAKLTAKLVKAGVLNFADAVNTAREHLGEEFTRKIAPLLEHGWNHIRTNFADHGMDEAGSVHELLVPSGDERSPHKPAVALADQVTERLRHSDDPWTHDEFFAVADKEFGGTRAEGRYGDSQAYDALELGVNKAVLAATNPQADAEEARRNVRWIEGLSQRVPYHKTRTGEKDTLQQFSTPPAYAYAATWAANVTPKDVVLEPSAGAGGIVVHAINAGAKVYANEIDESRAELLRQLPLEGVFTEDAEHIDAIIKNKMPQPSVVVMNPPFSRAGRRLGNKKIVGTDRKHVDAALRLLAPNGRLVAIVGLGTGFNKGEGKGLNNWLDDLPYNVRANIEVARDVYKGHGTQFPTRLLVIDKKPRAGKTVTGQADNLLHLIDLLTEVRNDRAIATAELEPAEPTRQASAGEAHGGNKLGIPVHPTTGGVGDGQASGVAGRPLTGDSVGSPAEPIDDTGRGPATIRAPESGGTGRRRKLGGKRGAERSGKPGGSDAGRDAGGPGVGVGGQSVHEHGGGVPVPGEIERPVELEQTKPGQKKELGDATYEPYEPHVRVKGAKKHPAAIVESAAMSAINPPPITYRPNIADKVVQGYKLGDGTQVGISDLQLEAVAYAGHAHQQLLADGSRRGFMIGDGTGVGKAREAAGVILDNWNQGRRKAVWISKNASLFETSREEWKRVGGDPAKVFNQSKVASGAPVTAKDGILFTTYTTNAQDASNAAKAKGKNKTRLDQIVDWLGPNFDGVIVFDEAHEMGNSSDQKVGRNKQKASQKATAGLELQAKLPNARVIYLSATAATEVRNLGYAPRLGLWGEGTPFANRDQFINEISAGGVAAMEKTAADMKALGVYTARNISFNDGTPRGTVEYERIEHLLTEDQRAAHTKMAEAYLVVFQNMNKALELTEANKSGKGKGNALGQFWSANQRFWNQVVTAMQTPAVIRSIEKDLAEGRSAVVQLTNTNEAAQKRALEKKKQSDDDDFSQVDVSPKYILMDYLERSFPTQKYEVTVNEAGNEEYKPVVDSKGNAVHDPESLAMKERMLDEVGSLQVASRSALDMVIDHFGEDMVAEVTGRGERIVKEGGKYKLQKRSLRSRRADIDAFMDGRKRVLIFSDAGGTGASYHADLSRKNQQQRSHYLLQAGWRADTAIQGLGRSHRSNQAQAPKYFLVHTDLKGQKRFISTIARRLAQLGALTKGQRQAGESGIFTASDNLESTEARAALRGLFDDIMGGTIPEIGPSFLKDVMGLDVLNEKTGGMKAELPPITQFMNRVLSLAIDQQNMVFDEFQKRLDAKVEQAIASGTLDQGMETVKADRIRKVSEQTAYVHPTGAETKHVVVNVFRKTKPKTWDAAQSAKIRGFVRSNQTGKVWIVEDMGITEQDSRGRMSKRMRLVGPMESQYTTEMSMSTSGNWEKLTKADAKGAWDEAVANAPPFSEDELHILSGVLLPIWDRMPKGHTQVKRLLTDDGEQILGRVIPKNEITQVLKKLGVAVKAPKLSSQEAVDRVLKGDTLVLANEWKVKRSRVEGEWTIELVGPQYTHNAELDRQGVFRRRVQYDTRYFLPTGENAAKVLEAVTKSRPIAEVESVGGDVLSLVEPAPASGSTKQTTSTDARKPGDDKDSTATADILKTWERLFAVPIRIGGFSKRAAGIYKAMPEMVRMQEHHYGNLAVAAHEVAHHIDKDTEISDHLDPVLAHEVAGLDYEPKARVFEGWAEYLRHYITETDAGAIAPQFTEWFEQTWMPQHPRWTTAILEARGHARKYADQSVFQRIRSLIGYHPGDDLAFSERWKQRTQTFLGRSYRLWVDKFSPLKLIQEEAEKRGRTKIGVYDMAMAQFMSASPNAAKAAADGAHSIRDGRKLGTGKAIQGLSKHLKNDAEYDEAIAYTYARHTLYESQHNPGYNTGMDVEDAKAWMQHVEQDADQKARFEAFAEDLADINNDLLEMAVDAGALSPGAKKKVIDRYGKRYMPLHRVQDEKSFMDGPFGGSKFVNLPAAVRRRSSKGSGRQIIDPVDATLSRMVQLYGRAAQARVAHTLVETIDPKMNGVEGLGGFADRIDPKAIVHQGTVEEILGTLVEQGIVDEGDARAMRIAAKLLSGSSDRLSPDDWMWFSKRHGLNFDKDSLGDYQAAASQEPDVMATISLWRADYTPNAKKATVVIHDKGGNPIMYQFERELYDTATGMDEVQFRGFLGIMRSASRWFKSGAVGLSTGFGTANLLRDYWEYQGKAEHVKGLASLGKPAAMLGRYVAYKARKAAGMPTDDALIDLFEEAGGKIYSRIGHDVPSRQRTRRRMLAKSTWSKLGISLEHPGEAANTALEALQETIAVTDAPPRLAEMEASLKNNGYERRGADWYHNGHQVDRLPEDVRIRAINAAAEATVNFKRVGAWGRNVEAFVPFFNATSQAIYRQGVQLRSFRSLGKGNTEDAAARRALVYFAALAAAGVLHWMFRHDDDDYREQEPWLKDGYWTWGENGKTYVRIPKPRDAAVVSNVAENMLDAWYYDDTEPVTDVVGRDLLGRLPTGGGLVRGGVETFVADYDYFRGRELTPDYLKQEPKELQFTPYTLETSKAIGKLTGPYLGVSPIQAEHLLSSASGGAYRRLADGAEAAYEGRLGPEHAPFIRGVVINRHQARSLDDFYREWGQVKLDAKREQANGNATATAGARKDRLDDYAALMTKIRALDKKDMKGRRKFLYEPYLVGLAREALGRAPLEHNPSPFAKDVPEEIKGAVQDFAKRKAETAILSSRYPEKVHVGDASYEETVNRWKAGREADERWLRDHEENAIVRAAIRETLRSPRFHAIRKGDGQPQHDLHKESLNEYRQRHDRWWEIRARAFAWLKP